MNLLSITRPDGTLRPLARLLLEWKERIIGRPFCRLALANRRNLVGVEIGVFAGEHARQLLSRNSIAKLHLVDPYTAYTQFDQDTLNRASARAIKCLSRFSARIVWHRCSSFDAATAFGSIGLRPDFAYIDGPHDYSSVKMDCTLWWPLIKSGGVMGGHDFDPNNTPVIRAVTEFAVHKQLTLKVATPDWWIEKP